ncbi:hypothetical protein J6590_073109 [Homalodisca vitripennis]|nr:hypothetical protein J6590_073109 [Homalodisca vitripennis]
MLETTLLRDRYSEKAWNVEMGISWDIWHPVKLSTDFNVGDHTITGSIQREGMEVEMGILGIFGIHIKLSTDFNVGDHSITGSIQREGMECGDGDILTSISSCPQISMLETTLLRDRYSEKAWNVEMGISSDSHCC